MSIEIYSWDDLPDDSKENVANLVSSYTQRELGEKPQMLPITPQEVFAKFTGATAMTGRVFAGYIAASKPIAHAGSKMSEIGSLWVPKGFRGQGIAHKLVKHISTNVSKKSVTPFSFCNPLSLGVFLDSDYRQAAQEEIPAESFGLCANCPAKPGTGCCDTTVIYEEK